MYGEYEYLEIRLEAFNEAFRWGMKALIWPNEELIQVELKKALLKLEMSDFYRFKQEFPELTAITNYIDDIKCMR